VAETSRQPLRTCLGCRQVKDQNSLVRLVCSPDNDILVDLRGRLPGRGAYICNSRECIEQVVSKQQFNRAFRRECRRVSADELLVAIRDGLLDYLSNLLGMARKSSSFIAGSNAVIDAMSRKTALAVVLLAADISPKIGEKVRRKAEFNKIKVVELFDKAELGRILGRAERSVVGLPDGKLADAFLKDLQRYQDISGDY
jgi:predicted RNA-binding protein YlxR (DUF448 family)/ribosomal protein L30E